MPSAVRCSDPPLAVPSSGPSPPWPFVTTIEDVPSRGLLNRDALGSHVDIVPGERGFVTSHIIGYQPLFLCNRVSSLASSRSRAC